MNGKFTLIIGVFIALLSGGCASTYRSIDPPKVNYSTNMLEDGIGFSYRYDVLSESNNRKYAKHEKSRGLKLVALKITNFTGNKLNLANDVTFYSGDRVIYPVDPFVVKNQLKQGVAEYLLYLLLTPVNFYTYSYDSNSYDSNGTSRSYPVGLVLGPAISFGNMISAGSANLNFYDELIKYNINTEVENEQTVYCLVGFRDIGYEPLSLKLKKK